MSKRTVKAKQAGAKKTKPRVKRERRRPNPAFGSGMLFGIDRNMAIFAGLSLVFAGLDIKLPHTPGHGPLGGIPCPLDCPNNSQIGSRFGGCHACDCLGTKQ